MNETTRFEIRCQMAADGKPPVLNIRDKIGRKPISSGSSGVASEDVVRFVNENRAAPDMEVRINSAGGNSLEGIAIFEALRNFRGRLTTVNEGLAGSAAALIFTAGDRRLMASGSQFAIHDAYMPSCSGNADVLRRVIDSLEAMSQKYAELMAIRIGRPVDYVRSKMKADTWYDVDSAIREGFATGKSGEASRMEMSYDMAGLRNAPPAFAKFQNAVSESAVDKFSIVM